MQFKQLPARFFPTDTIKTKVTFYIFLLISSCTCGFQPLANSRWNRRPYLNTKHEDSADERLPKTARQDLKQSENDFKKEFRSYLNTFDLLLSYHTQNNDINILDHIKHALQRHNISALEQLVPESAQYVHYFNNQLISNVETYRSLYRSKCQLTHDVVIPYVLQQNSLLSELAKSPDHLKLSWRIAYSKMTDNTSNMKWLHYVLKGLEPHESLYIYYIAHLIEKNISLLQDLSGNIGIETSNKIPKPNLNELDDLIAAIKMYPSPKKLFTYMRIQHNTANEESKEMSNEFILFCLQYPQLYKLMNDNA